MSGVINKRAVTWPPHVIRHTFGHDTLTCTVFLLPKGFIGRTDAEAEAPILWPPDVKSRLIRKDPDAGKDRRQEEKGMTVDEMVGWHH